MSYQLNAFTNLPDLASDLTGYVPYQSDGGMQTKAGAYNSSPWGGFYVDVGTSGGNLNAIFLNSNPGSGQADVLLNNSDGSAGFSFGYYQPGDFFFLSDNVAVQFWTVDRNTGNMNFNSQRVTFNSGVISLGDSGDGSASFASGACSIDASGNLVVSGGNISANTIIAYSQLLYGGTELLADSSNLYYINGSPLAGEFDLFNPAGQVLADASTIYYPTGQIMGDLSGNLNYYGLFQLNGTTVIDASRNATFASTKTTTFGLNLTPIARQTTGVVSASFVVNSGTAVNTGSTFAGYTIAQVVKALQLFGLLT